MTSLVALAVQFPIQRELLLGKSWALRMLLYYPYERVFMACVAVMSEEKGIKAGKTTQKTILVSKSDLPTKFMQPLLYWECHQWTDTFCHYFLDFLVNST